MYVDVTSDPQRFLDAGSEFLLTDPVLNSVLLSVATHRSAHPDPDPDAPAPTWALIRDDATAVEGEGAVLGVAMRTPPRGVLVSRLPAGGAAALTEALLPTCADAPTIGGPAPDIEELAEVWCARLGVSVEVGMAQRIYRLDRVFPVTGVSGKVRKARAGDLEVLTDWTLAFEREIAAPGGEPSRDQAAARLEQRLSEGRAYVWDDEGIVSYVGTSPMLGGIVRIGPVYTSPEYRAHGYASALTAAVSRQALADGAEACSLYTDLANPTSNQIYAAVGYRPLCDATTYLVRTGS